jgi:hypothetical protein
MKKENKQKPVKSFKDYPAEIAVWKKNIKDGKKTFTVYNSSILCTYKDENDEYKTTSSFKEQDLLKVALLAQKAYNWINNAKQEIYEQQKKSSKEDDKAEEKEEEEIE